MTTFAKKKAGGKGVSASGNGGLMSNNLLKNKQIGITNEVQEPPQEPIKKLPQKSAFGGAKYKEKAKSGEVKFIYFIKIFRIQK